MLLVIIRPIDFGILLVVLRFLAGEFEALNPTVKYSPYFLKIFVVFCVHGINMYSANCEKGFEVKRMLYLERFGKI